jgi:hypothetical protein
LGLRAAEAMVAEQEAEDQEEQELLVDYDSFIASLKGLMLGE